MIEKSFNSCTADELNLMVTWCNENLSPIKKWDCWYPVFYFMNDLEYTMFLLRWGHKS